METIKIPILKHNKKLFKLIKNSMLPKNEVSRKAIDCLKIENGFLFATDSKRLLKFNLKDYEVFKLENGIYSAIFTKDEMILTLENGKEFADVDYFYKNLEIEKEYFYKAYDFTLNQFNAYLAKQFGYIYNQEFLIDFLKYTENDEVKIGISRKNKWGNETCVLVLSYKDVVFCCINILLRNNEEIFKEII